MDTTRAILEQGAPAAPARPAGAGQPPAAPRAAVALDRFVRAQALNTTRHAAALRPFRSDEFGTGAASPSEAHIQAANVLIVQLRRRLLALVARVGRTAESGSAEPSPDRLASLLVDKDRTGEWVKQIERVWDYYFELFGQRQSRFADWLLAADRISLDCYQAVYTRLGTARSIPSPGPFACMETGFTPATIRRGVAFSRLSQRANPFPVIKLPYHRLVNPWTLGAAHHEVSHNIQSDLGLWTEVPRRIHRRLRQAGAEPLVAATWARWHKEIWADLCALLLGGPAIVASLMDVVALAPARTFAFNPAGVHPTPYLRVFISIELLRRMGFRDEAEMFRTVWERLYPAPRKSAIPPAILDTFPPANRLVVDTISFQPFGQLGNKSLAQVVRFEPSHAAMVQEAAARLAAGTDPGIIPARFLVGAARWAVDHRFASSNRITRNFYQALVRR